MAPDVPGAGGVVSWAVSRTASARSSASTSIAYGLHRRPPAPPLAIAQELFARFPEYSEGQLAKVRAHVVSRQSCARVARELELGPLLAERGEALPDEELERLVRNRNILAALLEQAIVPCRLFSPPAQAGDFCITPEKVH